MSLMWLYDSFQPYCERNGIKLLADDMRFIAKHLSYIPAERHKVVMMQYLDEWKAGMDGNCLPLARMNTGRRAANAYLRDAVDGKI